MKKITVGVLSLIFMAACSKDNSSTNTPLPIFKSQTNEISLAASVNDVTTRVSGPINSTFSTDFPIGVYANNGAWLAGASGNWINNDHATVAGAAGHAISFGSGPYYYPIDGSTLNFFAYAPAATESTPAGSGTAPKVTINLTGQEDVMWATSTGYKVGSAPAVAPALDFQHRLTQLQFTFKSGTSYPASGNSIVSLLVKAQPTSLVLDVSTGTYTTSGSGDMQALSLANQIAGIGITAAGTNASSPIMTLPHVGSSAYYLDITVKPSSSSTNVVYSNVPVNVSSIIGSAHMVTITFFPTSITASATVADWVNGSGGSATAQ